MGLLDFSDPDSLSQLGMAFGLLNAKRGDNWPALLAQAAQAQEARKQRALQEQLMQQQLQMGGLDLKSKTQSFEDTQRARDILRGMGGEQQPPDEPMGAPVAPVRPFPAPGGGTMVAPGPASPGKNQTFAYYSALAQKMMQNGLPDQAQKYLDLAEKFRPKLKDTKTLTDPNTNQRVTVNFYEDGTREVVPFAPDKEKAHFADTGGSIAALDPYTGQPIGDPIAKTVSPDARLSASTAIRSQNMTDARARQQLDQEKFSQPFEVTRDGKQILVQQDKRSGALFDVNTKQPVSGVGPKMGEAAQSALTDVRKLTTTLDGMISTFKPEYVGAKGSVGEFSDQYMTQAPLIGDAFGDPNRVQFRQQASTIVNDYIKAITGATVGQSGEQQRLMRAVPAPGDSPMVYKAKLIQMKKNLEQLPSILQAGQTGGVSSGFRVLGKE